MGKYDKVVGRLERAAPPPYQERIETEKAEFAGQTPEQLAIEYAEARLEKDKLEALMSPVNLRIEALAQLLAESQERRDPAWGRYGAKSNALRLENGDTVRIEYEPMVSIVDQDAFREWCVKNGYERQLRLMPSTAASVVKERLLEGEEPPDGTKAEARSKLVFTRAKDDE